MQRSDFKVMTSLYLFPLILCTLLPCFLLLIVKPEIVDDHHVIDQFPLHLVIQQPAKGKIKLFLKLVGADTFQL